MRFAEYVEKIDPPKSGIYSSSSSPQINHVENGSNIINEFNEDSAFNVSIESKSITPTFKTSLRRSFSLSDINKLTLLDSDQDSLTDKSLQDQLLIASQSNNVINVTFDKSLNSSHEDIFQSRFVNHADILLPINHNFPASSPIMKSVTKSDQTLEIQFEKINKSLQMCIDNLTDKPELAQLKEEILSHKDTIGLFSSLNCKTDNLPIVDNRSNTGITLKTKSTGDILAFLSLADSLETCIKFYRNNICVE